jgi:hypothetical protein
MAIMSSESQIVEPKRSDAQAPEDTKVASGYYVIGVLLLINIFNYMDRVLPHVMAESFRRDLHLTDTQLGLLNGFAFTGVYALFSLPLARLAGRSGDLRRTLCNSR